MPISHKDPFTEEGFSRFGFEKRVPTEPDKEPFWWHPSYGAVYQIPTPSELLHKVFGLGYERGKNTSLESRLRDEAVQLITEAD